MYEARTLENHQCSDEELGLANYNNIMWPTKGTSADVVKSTKDLFFCVDPKELELYGRGDTSSGSVIYVDVIKCTGKDSCKNDE